MPVVNDSALTWRRTGQGPGQGERPLSPCTQVRFDQLGATEVVHRSFAWGPDGSRVRGTHVVGRFASVTEARAALNAFAVEVDACDHRFPTAGPAEPVELHRGTAFRWHVTIGTGIRSRWEFAAVVRVGAVVGYVTYSTDGQDVPSTTRITPTVRHAARRLA